MTQLLDESWKHWVHENMGLGISNQTIYNTLKNREFDLEDITNVMGWSPDGGGNETDTQSIVKPKKQKLSSNKSDMNLRTIYDKKELLHERKFIDGAEKIEVENDVLDIYKIDNFLSEGECEELVDLIKSDMQKSSISNPQKSQGHYDDSIRTSSTCNLHKSHGELVNGINERINACLGIHLFFAEPIQGQHYDKTQEFKEHTDTFTPNTKEYDTHAKSAQGGQRTWTFMIYLNETTSGGETKFPRVKDSNGDVLSLTPKQGQAIVWNNLYVNGDINHFSTHQGCPVVDGEKTIITKWYRERRRR